MRRHELVRVAAYANPVRDKVSIRVAGEYVGSLLRLVNAAGAQLRERTIPDEIFEVNLDKYPAGTYLLYTYDRQAVTLAKN